MSVQARARELGAESDSESDAQLSAGSRGQREAYLRGYRAGLSDERRVWLELPTLSWGSGRRSLSVASRESPRKRLQQPAMQVRQLGSRIRTPQARAASVRGWSPERCSRWPGQRPEKAPSHAGKRRPVVMSAASETTRIRTSSPERAFEGRPWRGASDASESERRSRQLPGLRHPSKVPHDRSRGGAGDRRQRTPWRARRSSRWSSRSRRATPPENAVERHG
jgi:hypothetical protein